MNGWVIKGFNSPKLKFFLTLRTLLFWFLDSYSRYYSSNETRKYALAARGSRDHAFSGVGVDIIIAHQNRTYLPAFAITQSVGLAGVRYIAEKRCMGNTLGS